MPIRKSVSVINDAALAYRGVIPVDQWREPYMPADALSRPALAFLRRSVPVRVAAETPGREAAAGECVNR